MTSLSALPDPTPPVCTMLDPRRDNTTRARSTSPGVPPASTVSVPPSAAGTLPSTGAST